MHMLFANVSIADKYNYLEDKFLKAYKWLKETDIASLEVGSYPIDGDQVVANVQAYTTIPDAEARFETHDKFFDIQYVDSGIETFGVCKRDGLKETERNDANDVVFYEDPEFSGSVILQAGDLVIVAPEDAHKPRVQAGGPCDVKKVVIKVAV